MTTEATIEIYCDEPSHDDRRWTVELLTRGDDGFWSAKRHPGLGTGSAVQFLADDDRLTGRKLPDPPDEDSPVGDRLRGRYRLRCRHCGFAVALREENAVPVFERLAANDIHAVSLRGLAAILRGNSETGRP